jgi:hypothetical protein
MADRIMARFVKTKLHVVSAVLALLGLYASAGLVYALWKHSEDSVAIWATIAVAAFIAAYAWQYVVAKRRRRTQ